MTVPTSQVNNLNWMTGWFQVAPLHGLSETVFQFNSNL